MSSKENYQKTCDLLNVPTKIFVFADKTRNMYGLDPKECSKLLNNNVTKSYKKSNIKTVNEINKEANILTEKLKIIIFSASLTMKHLLQLRITNLIFLKT